MERVAIAFANWVLRTFAPRAARTIDFLIRRGMLAVDEDRARAAVSHLN